MNFWYYVGASWHTIILLDVFTRNFSQSVCTKSNLCLFMTVGPCALDFSKMKTQDHFWTDPPADELVQRHRIHSSQRVTQFSSVPASPKRPSLQVKTTNTVVRMLTDQVPRWWFQKSHNALGLCEWGMFSKTFCCCQKATCTVILFTKKHYTMDWIKNQLLQWTIHGNCILGAPVIVFIDKLCRYGDQYNISLRWQGLQCSIMLQINICVIGCISHCIYQLCVHMKINIYKA